MKKLFTLFTIAALTISSFAQSPQKMSYHAVVRNTSGVLQANQAVGMKISILQGSETGTAVYVETQTKTTNANGLVTLEIGSGTIISGTFSGIDWSNGTYFIKTETDPTGGTSYTITGTSQILSVPYALYAKTANYNDLKNKPLLFDGAWVNITGKPTTLTGYGITDAVTASGNQTISGTKIFKGTTPDMEEALFEVKNKDGQTIFAVYNEGVRIWVADGAKGTKGRFAVGGFDMIQNYLDVSADSVRIYIDSDPSTKKAKGGFAVGGYDMTKGIAGDYLNVSGRSEAETINGESRVMWYPAKEAFRSGKVLIESQDSVGTNSWASGFNSKAVGDWSQALGYKAIARADYATAIGKNAVAAKINSFAFGEDAKAENEESYAIGRGAVASGYRSFAFGSAGIDSAGNVTDVARAIGDYSVAIGQGSLSVGFGGLSMGIADTANGKYSIALGYQCSANKVGSVSLGYSSKANGYSATAIGYFSEAKGSSSTAIGNGAVASGPFSTAIGVSTKAIGGYSTALGEMTTSGYGATAMGGFTIASGDYSTAMGQSTTATRLGATAMGASSRATGGGSTAMGNNTYAEGDGSTAMGQSTEARGKYSTAMGYHGVARGDNSTDMGYFTVAKPYASLVLGRYNDTTCSVNGSTSWVATDPLFIVGVGTSHSSRSNALTILKNGNIGIGTSTPLRTLHTSTPTISNEFIMEVRDGLANWKKWNFVVDGGVGVAQNFNLRILNDAGTTSSRDVMSWNNNGNVGIGTTTANYKLDVRGTIGNNTTLYHSDMRWKTDIKPIKYGINELVRLNSISYLWNTDDYPDMGFDKETQFGFIAQEFEQVIPELVRTDKDGYKSIDYVKVTPVLVEAIKEQQQQIESVKQENRQLKSELGELKTLINSLMANQKVQKDD